MTPAKVSNPGGKGMKICRAKNSCQAQILGGFFLWFPRRDSGGGQAPGKAIFNPLIVQLLL